MIFRNGLSSSRPEPGQKRSAENLDYLYERYFGPVVLNHYSVVNRCYIRARCLIKLFSVVVRFCDCLVTYRKHQRQTAM